ENFRARPTGGVARSAGGRMLPKASRQKDEPEGRLLRPRSGRPSSDGAPSPSEPGECEGSGAPLTGVPAPRWGGNTRRSSVDCEQRRGRCIGTSNVLAVVLPVAFDRAEGSGLVAALAACRGFFAA